MKSIKKSLLIGLALLMVFSSVACQSGKGTGGGKAGPGEKEIITLTMIQRLPASYVVEDNPIIEEWGRRTSTKLEIEAPPINNYGDRLNIVMASGDIPDIIYLGNTGTLYHQWAADGLLLKLDDYFDKSMPNAKAVLTEEELYFTRVAELDNGLFSLPRVQTKPWDNIIYRKDWLEAVGKEVPVTPEEFADVMLAFAKEDPDGNNKDDTYGWTYNRVMGPMHRNMVNAFGLRPTSVPDENGNYAIMQAQPGYMEFVDWLRDMYESGALDPEWYLIKMYEDDDMWAAGKIGTIYSNKVTEHMAGNARLELQKVNPEAELVAGPPLRAKGKSVSDVYYNPQIWGNYAISADCKHIDRAVEFLDYGYTDECNELLLIGIEGVTYTSFDPDKRTALKTDEQVEASLKYVASYATINYQRQDKGLLLANGNTEEEHAIFNEAYETVGKHTNRISYLPEGSLPGLNEVNVKITDSGIRDKYDELETKYICGQISREDFVKFIENEFIPAYDEYIKIVAEAGLNK
jgi:putative aldouronate transport system substrate-binding protein